MENKLAKLGAGTTLALLTAQPTAYYANIQVRSVIEALQCKGPTLAVIRKATDQVYLKALLVKAVTDLVSFFNVGKSMDNTQVAQTVELIIEQYYFLKLEDFKVCFNGVKGGKYLQGGKLFDRLDGQIILLAIQLYNEERMAEAEKITLEEHKQRSDDEKREEYLISDGKYYLRETDKDNCEWVKEQQLATRYSLERAWKIKNWLGKNQIASKIVKPKPAFTLAEYIAEHHPDWLKEEGAGTKLSRQDYHAKRNRIMETEGISDLEKYNAIRAISGMQPVTQAEFELVNAIQVERK